MGVTVGVTVGVGVLVGAPFVGVGVDVGGFFVGVGGIYPQWSGLSPPGTTIQALFDPAWQLVDESTKQFLLEESHWHLYSTFLLPPKLQKLFGALAPQKSPLWEEVSPQLEFNRNVEQGFPAETLPV